jgi:hypothetical protein
MGLGLRPIFAVDHDFGLGEALLDVAAAALRFRPAYVAGDGEVLGDRDLRDRRLR